MPNPTRKQNKPTKLPDHAFIDQGPESSRHCQSRLVSSQARRYQSADKRRQQNLSAKEGAGYARSLVGWRSASSTPPVESLERLSASPKKSKSPELRQLAGESETRGTSDIQTSPLPRDSTRTKLSNTHIWSRHRPGNFDDLMAFTTQLRLCCPLASQDDMVFDATTAAMRAAWVLTQKKDPSEDKFMLYHRGLAMTSLREKLCSATIGCKTTVIFTIGKMISIAYLSGELEAFVAHFEAFHKIALEYISEDPESSTSEIIKQRVASWKALHTYRTSQNLVRGKEDDECPPNALSSREDTPPTWQRPARSPGLLRGIDLHIDLARSLQNLVQLLQRTTESCHSRSPQKATNATHEIIEHCRQISEMLRICDGVTPVDIQLCCALMVFCLQLHKRLLDDATTASYQHEDSDDFDSLPALDDVASTLINQQLHGFDDFDEHKMILTWCALVTGSFLVQQSNNRLRTKGHIIHVSLAIKLSQTIGCFSPELADHGWHAIEMLLRGNDGLGSLWTPLLTLEWQHDWQGRMRRQRRWEEDDDLFSAVPRRMKASSTGAFSRTSRDGDTSTPRTSGMWWERNEEVDIIEHLVLRESCNSLPRVF